MMLLALNHTALDTTTTFSEEIFGIGVLWCCLIFFALNTFVIFGIKEYFRKYSNRFPNYCHFRKWINTYSIYNFVKLIINLRY